MNAVNDWLRKLIIVQAPPVLLAHAASDVPSTIREYVLIPDGHVRSKSGDFTLDAAGAAAIIAAFQAQGACAIFS